MTLVQLETLGRLMRANKQSISFLSAKLVLVDGKSQTEAAKELGTKKNTVNNGVQRYKRAYEEIKHAFQW